MYSIDAKELVQKITKQKSKVIIYCAGEQGEYVCAQLFNEGAEIISFCDNNLDKQKTKILGIPVLSYSVCRDMYVENVVYVIASASFFTAEQIIKQLEIDGLIYGETVFNSLLVKWDNCGLKVFSKILSNKSIVLYGETYLCGMMRRWLSNNVHTKNVIEYEEGLTQVTEDVLWIYLERPGISTGTEQKEMDSEKNSSVCRYFLKNLNYCIIDINQTEYFKEKVNTVVLLVDSGCSGSFLINSLLDSHPNIMNLGWNRFAFDIWRYVKLSVGRKTSEIISFIVMQLKLDYKKASEIFPQDLAEILTGDRLKDIFMNISNKEYLTEREIFINLQIAYYTVLHDEYDFKNKPIIYMDVHTDWKALQNSVLIWLQNMGFEVIALKIIRNPILRLGSYFKFLIAQLGLLTADNVCHFLLDYSMEEKMDMDMEKIKYCRIRFEDLKLYPNEILHKLCEQFKIPWSETLLRTTDGEKEAVYYYTSDNTSGFDLKPVYYQYDEYFSSFDKFRLDLLFGAKEKAYNYSYSDDLIYKFDREQITELFRYPYKFEKYIVFSSEKEKDKFREKLYSLCRNQWKKVLNAEQLGDEFDFGEYIVK